MSFLYFSTFQGKDFYFENLTDLCTLKIISVNQCLEEKAIANTPTWLDALNDSHQYIFYWTDL